MRGDDHRLARQVGARIRHLRREHGLSQEAFAERCDLHRTYIGAIERGEKTMTIATASKLASALGVSLSELFHGLGIPARLPGAGDDAPRSTQPVMRGSSISMRAMRAGFMIAPDSV